MNNTVNKILQAAYLEAKWDFKSKKALLNSAVQSRGNAERELVSRRTWETAAAVNCQQAEIKMKDLEEFLREAGVFV